MSSEVRFLHKKHNVSVLLYHLVCPTKYRQVVIDEEVDLVLREVCLEIAQRYEIAFIEIGTGRPLGSATMCIFWCKVCRPTAPSS